MEPGHSQKKEASALHLSNPNRQPSESAANTAPHLYPRWTAQYKDTPKQLLPKSISEMFWSLAFLLDIIVLVEELHKSRMHSRMAINYYTDQAFTHHDKCYSAHHFYVESVAIINHDGRWAQLVEWL
jgi:hypothetical protein